MGSAVKAQAAPKNVDDMRGITSSLWPIRYKPLPDELLSFWLIRLAHGHGLKVQTFCNLIFGNHHQVWNRDIDRLGSEWLLQELHERTGTPMQMVRSTTLRSFEGLLYPHFLASGTLQWIQTLKLYHRKHEGFGMQYCPQCLREGPEPYFRKSWRVSFNTICIKHQCMLHDRCPACGAGVAYHRLDVGQSGESVIDSMATCYACLFDLRRAKAEPIISFDEQALSWHQHLCTQISNISNRQPILSLNLLAVMHQITYLLTSKNTQFRLCEHICDMLDIQKIQISPGKIAFESRSLLERHQLLQLVAWLMVDLEPRLRVARRAKAIRYNHMTKDFENAPQWYLDVVEKFSNWRKY